MAAAEVSTTQVSAIEALQPYFLYHGTCHHCCHLHIALPIRAAPSESESQDYSCEECGSLMFKIGRTSPQTSVASAETLLNRQDDFPSHVRPEDCCCDEPVASPAPDAPCGERHQSASDANNRAPGRSAIPSGDRAERRSDRSRRTRGSFRSRWKKAKDQVVEHLRRVTSGRNLLGTSYKQHIEHHRRRPTFDRATMTEAAIFSPASALGAAFPQRAETGGIPRLQRDAGTSRGVAAASYQGPKSKRMQDHRRERTLAHGAEQRRRCFCSNRCPCMGKAQADDLKSIKAAPNDSPPQPGDTPDEPAQGPNAPEEGQQSLLHQMGSHLSRSQPRNSRHSSSVSLEDAAPAAAMREQLSGMMVDGHLTDSSDSHHSGDVNGGDGGADGAPAEQL